MIAVARTFRKPWAAISLCCLGFILFCALVPFAKAQTAEHPNHPVHILDREEGFIAIVDEIDFRTPLAFERTLAEVPNVTALFLNSPGGSVHSALAIASRVKSLGIITAVPKESACMSACSLIFFAGQKRLAWGKLGVHQISSAGNQGNLVSGQFALADVIEAMSDYNVPSEVIAIMLRTPPEDMYVFSKEENLRFGFLSSASPKPPAQNQQTARRSVDLTDPATWRGKMITGRLLSNGKLWYASLNADGSAMFEFTSGQRSFGTYHVSNGRVCFKLGTNQDFTCRRPVKSTDGVRWYSDDGKFQSIIVGVDETKIAAIAPATNKSAEIWDYIRPGQCALIVASRSSIAEARAFVRANVSDRRYVKGFLSSNGWIAISIGTLRKGEVSSVMSDWKRSGRIPQDSFCSTGTKFTAVVDLGFN